MSLERVEVDELQWVHFFRNSIEQPFEGMIPSFLGRLLEQLACLCHVYITIV